VGEGARLPCSPKEVEQVLPAELHSTEEIDDLLSTFETHIGISLYEDLAAAKAARATVDPIVSESPGSGLERQGRRCGKRVKLGPYPRGCSTRTNDPVRPLPAEEMGFCFRC